MSSPIKSLITCYIISHILLFGNCNEKDVLKLHKMLKQYDYDMPENMRKDIGLLYEKKYTDLLTYVYDIKEDNKIAHFLTTFLKINNINNIYNLIDYNIDNIPNIINMSLHEIIQKINN